MPTTSKRGQARRRPRQLRARQTVEAILDAVVRLLTREGVAAVTTNRIAEIAGVSIGSVYQYFPNKHAIFVALHRRHIDEVDRVIETTLVEHVGSPLKVLVSALMDAMIDLHSANPELYELLQGQVPDRADGTKAFPIRLHGAFLLAIGRRAGETKREVNWNKFAFVLAHLIESLAHGVVLRRPPGVSFKDARNESIRALCSYLETFL
jgi:AcrR family transcriptional regulator